LEFCPSIATLMSTDLTCLSNDSRMFLIWPFFRFTGSHTKTYPDNLNGSA
jgi:hypothetical protein